MGDRVKPKRASEKHADVRKALETHRESWVDRIDEWYEVFAVAFSKYGVVALAAREAGVPTVSVYAARKRWPWFDELCKQAHQEAIDRIEAQAFAKAVKGESDTLTKFMLKSHRPEVYNPEQRISVRGMVEHTHHHKVVHEQRIVVRHVLAKPHLAEAAREIAEIRMRVRAKLARGEDE